MSFFVRLPSLETSLPVYMKATAADDGSLCIFGTSATEAELADNHGLGADLRIGAMVVQNSPAVFALYSQARGVSSWLTYDPVKDTLVFSESLTEGSRFTTQYLDLDPGHRYLYNAHHKVYLTVFERDGNIVIGGSATCTDDSKFLFTMDHGTGPLMPGRRYFITSIFGLHLTVRDNTLAQTVEAGEAEEFLVENGARVNCGPEVYCYRFQARDGRYVNVQSDATIVLQADGGENATFQLGPDPGMLGGFKLGSVKEYLALRAEGSGRVTTGSMFDMVGADNWVLQCAERGPMGRTDAARNRPTTLFRCDPKCERVMGECMVAVRRRAREQAGGPVGPHHRLGRCAATPNPDAIPRTPTMLVGPPRVPRPAIDVRPTIAAPPSDVPALGMLPLEMEVSALKGAAGEAVLEAADEAPQLRSSLFAKKWLLFVLVLCFLGGVLLAAQLVVTHHRAH